MNNMTKAGPLFDPAQEYQTLRTELETGKRYVFERPLLILTVFVAALNLTKTPYIWFLPAGLVALLTFNFWFTGNRLLSMSRIIAYLQLELEERKLGNWVGWETCLRWYRKWHYRLKVPVEEIVDPKIDEEAVPDALMYYPPIYMLHVGLVLLAVLGSVINAAMNYEPLPIIGAIITVVISIPFIKTAFRDKPYNMRRLIERNRVIWAEVFELMQRNGVKKL
jgi:hypothetical protein